MRRCGIALEHGDLERAGPFGRHIHAEAAFSVETEYRRRGIGEKLFRRIQRAATNHGVETIEIICLPDNIGMQRLAQKFKTQFTFEENSLTGRLTARRPTAVLADAGSLRRHGGLRRLAVRRPDAANPLISFSVMCACVWSSVQKLSAMMMSTIMRRLGAGEITVHGMRAAFRSWSADQGVAFEVAESALAHTTRGVAAAYQWSSMLARRRPLMQDWSDFVTERPAKLPP